MCTCIRQRYPYKITHVTYLFYTKNEDDGDD